MYKKYILDFHIYFFKLAEYKVWNDPPVYCINFIICSQRVTTVTKTSKRQTIDMTSILHHEVRKLITVLQRKYLGTYVMFMQ